MYGICHIAAIGATDDKHIAVECPANSGSLYYNYEAFFSLILLVVFYAKYTFTLTDISSYGSNNDCRILAKYLIGKKFDIKKLNLSFAEELADFSSNPLNHFLVGDKIFPLKSWFLRGCLHESQDGIINGTEK